MELTNIQSKIHEIRGQKVMLDYDLAELYALQTKVLNQAVKRNLERFPEDFMFQLTTDEWLILKAQIDHSNPNWSQFVTSSRKYRGLSYLPYAFTEQGVAMLSSVLNSEKAIRVNVAIMRTFVAIRRLITKISNHVPCTTRPASSCGSSHRCQSQPQLRKHR